MHVHQQSERRAEREAFQATVASFVTRSSLSLSFVALVVLLEPRAAVVASVAWGMPLLAALSYRLARERAASPLAEIGKHCSVAMVVILVTLVIGAMIPRWLGSAR